MKDRILLTYPHRHAESSKALVEAVAKTIADAGFEIVGTPKDQTNGAKLRHCLRQVRAVVALYIPALPANSQQKLEKTSSWPEAAVDASRAGVGSHIDCIVIVQDGVEDFGLAKADGCCITVAYDPKDPATLENVVGKLKGRLRELQAAPKNCLIWTLNFDLAGFTATVNEDGSIVPALTEDQVTRAVEVKRSVGEVVYSRDIAPNHVIDTGDGGYFVYEGSDGADGKFMLQLAREVRAACPEPTKIHIALAAGQVTKCYSVGGGITYLGHPMNAAARINTSRDGSIHIDENFVHFCKGTRTAAELEKLELHECRAKHGQAFWYRALPGEQ